MAEARCHICDGKRVKIIPEFNSFHTVTSDCRPWRNTCKIGICRDCGIFQKIISNNFMKECERIYEGYCTYFQSNGKEQLVFDQKNGQAIPRSQKIIHEFSNFAKIPLEGKLLDFGCGNGNFLRSFGKHFPRWSMSGFELDSRYEKDILAISNVKGFFKGRIEDVPGMFDVVAMIHSLEHIPNPSFILKKIYNKLNKNGFLIIETPNFTQNPFDLIIADHCSHFSIITLQRCVANSGFELVAGSDSSIPKELTMIVRKQNRERDIYAQSKDISSEYDKVERIILWMKNLVAHSKRLSQKHRMGIFGTSIAGTWLYCELKGKIEFFIDEDPERIGKHFMGRPVYHPKQLPKGSKVFVVLPNSIALNIKKRLDGSNDNYVVPDPI